MEGSKIPKHPIFTTLQYLRRDDLKHFKCSDKNISFSVQNYKVL